MNPKLPSDNPYISKRIIYTATADSIEDALKQIDSLPINENFCNFTKRKKITPSNFSDFLLKVKLKASGRRNGRNKKSKLKRRFNSQRPRYCLSKFYTRLRLIKVYKSKCSPQ